MLSMLVVSVELVEEGGGEEKGGENLEGMKLE